MSTAEFSDEFIRAAERNGLASSKAAAVAELLELEDDEQCLNVFGGSPNANRELLVVTTVATCMISRGPFNVRHRWTILHRDLVEVAPVRAVASRGYVVDGIVLETRDETREFRIGFNDPSYVNAAKRDIAEANARIAAESVATAALEARGGVAAPAPVADYGGSPFHFDPQGPEKAAQAAQSAYGRQEWFESFQLYVKAVDKLHDFYAYEKFKNRQPSPGDAWIVQGVASSLGATRELQPEAPIFDGVQEVTHRLADITVCVGEAGGNPTLYEHTLNEVRRLTADLEI